VDLEGFEVADDEEGRVVESFAVVVELVVSLFEVFVLAFVLPGEVIATPDIGEAFAAAGFAYVFLEGVVFAGGVDVGRPGLVEDFAEVIEMGLGAGVFGLGEDLPFTDELRHGEGHG